MPLSEEFVVIRSFAHYIGEQMEQYLIGFTSAGGCKSIEIARAPWATWELLVYDLYTYKDVKDVPGKCVRFKYKSHPSPFVSDVIRMEVPGFSGSSYNETAKWKAGRKWAYENANVEIDVDEINNQNIWKIFVGPILVAANSNYWMSRASQRASKIAGGLKVRDLAMSEVVKKRNRQLSHSSLGF